MTIGDPRIERADQELRPELAHQIGRLQRRLGVLRPQAQAERRHAPVGRSDPQLDRHRPGRGRGPWDHAADAQHDRLLAGLAGLERIGPGLGQRPHIGLVGGIVPVAMVLHLEGIALHRAPHPHPRQHLMGQRPDVLERAHRVDQLGEGRALGPAVGVQDLDRLAGNPLDRVQDDEAGPVGDEVGDRPGGRLEAERAVGAALDLRPVAELLGRILADRLIAHLEAARALIDPQILDRRIVGAPVLVADDERDRPDRLLAADPDIAEIAAIELAAERPRAQHPARLHLLLGPEQHDRPRRTLGHDGSPFSPTLPTPPVIAPSPAPAEDQRQSARSASEQSLEAPDAVHDPLDHDPVAVALGIADRIAAEGHDAAALAGFGAQRRGAAYGRSSDRARGAPERRSDQAWSPTSAPASPITRPKSSPTFGSGPGRADLCKRPPDLRAATKGLPSSDRSGHSRDRCEPR